MTSKLHIKSLILGVVVGAVVACFVALAIVQAGDGPCWLHIKNTGTNGVTMVPMGGRLPVRATLRFGFLPVPQRMEYWRLTLQPGQSGSMPYGSGGTISVMDLSLNVWRQLLFGGRGT